MHTCKTMETEHAVKKLIERPKNDGVMGHRKYPNAGRGHGRNDLNFAHFAFDVMLMSACGGNWSMRAPRGGNLQLGFLPLDIVCCVLATWHRQWTRPRFVCFFFFFFCSRSPVRKKKSNLKHDGSHWSWPAKLVRRNVLVEQEATMLTCRYEGSANVPNWRMALCQHVEFDV